jgi:hypothetical protein
MNLGSSGIHCWVSGVGVGSEDTWLREEAMTTKRALKVVLGISLVGVAFSGTLTYRELCGGAGAGCSDVGAPGTILGYPACVYGLLMYLLLVVVASVGLRSDT